MSTYSHLPGCGVVVLSTAEITSWHSTLASKTRNDMSSHTDSLGSYLASIRQWIYHRCNTALVKMYDEEAYCTLFIYVLYIQQNMTARQVINWYVLTIEVICPESFINYELLIITTHPVLWFTGRTFHLLFLKFVNLE